MIKIFIYNIRPFAMMFLFLTSSKIVLAQENKWIPFVSSVNGTVLLYQYDALKRESFPPVVVAAKIFNYDPNKKNPAFDWEFFCPSKEIKVGSGNLISIASDKGTTRRILLEGFCGIRNAEGLWFAIGLNSSGQQYAINSDSLKRISNDEYSFVSSNIRINIDGEVSLALLEPKQEHLISCSDRSKIKFRNIGQDESIQTVESPKIAQAAIEMVCSGFIPVSSQPNMAQPTSNNQQSNLNERLEAAKKTCIELGFKEKSEKFADCVLKVTR